MLLLLISFVAGVLTVLAPCILPLLPVIVGGTVAGGSDRKRAYTVIGALAVSIILFTFLLKASTVLIGVPQYVWEWLSGGIVMALGLTMIFPALWEKLPFLNSLSRSSNRLVAEGYQKQSFWGDVLVGAALGPVFTTCSPTYFVILATVLPSGFVTGIAALLLYTAGLSLTLLLIALLGQRLVDKLGLAADTHGWLRRSVGALFLLVGLAVFTGTSKDIETWLLEHVYDITRIEQMLLEAR